MTIRHIIDVLKVKPTDSIDIKLSKKKHGSCLEQSGGVGESGF